MTYTVLNGFTAIIKFISGGRIMPADYDSREFWTCKFPNRSVLPLPGRLTLLSDKLRGKNVPWYLRASKWSYQNFWHQHTGERSDAGSEDDDRPVRVTELPKQTSSQYDVEASSRRSEVSH